MTSATHCKGGPSSSNMSMASASTAAAPTSYSEEKEPIIDALVLDAGPLVTRTSLTGLAKRYYVPASVVAELRDVRAREHFEWLQRTMNVEIRDAGPEALLGVTKFAKKTGDYAVLSRPDMSVLALTYALELERHGSWRVRDEVGGKTGQQKAEEAKLKQRKEEEKARGTEMAPKPKGQNGSHAPAPQKDDVVNPAEDASSEDDFHELEAEEETKEDGAKVEGRHEKANDVAMAAQVGKVSLDEADGHGKALTATETEEGAKNEDAQVVAQTADSTPSKDEITYEDDEDDEEEGGEWITPDNVVKHKNRSLGLVTDEDLPLSLSSSSKNARNAFTRPGKMSIAEGDDGWSTVTAKADQQQQRPQQPHQQNLAGQKKGKKRSSGRLTVACMTGDYAVQNVLLQMGLSLVGIEGQRIKQVKSWVLRCHACTKICKDSERKFCPHCGNPTLLRTSVTSTSPDAQGKAGAGTGQSQGGLQVHLKKNFQYRNRGTIYSLPLPKAGKAAGKAAAVPVLREDQAEWQRALQKEKVQRQKEEKRLNKALEKGKDSLTARYEDADELTMLLAGGTGKNRGKNGPVEMPEIGVGRKNPNERRRRKV